MTTHKKAVTILMKKNILHAPFIEEMVKTTANLYRLGWDERNGGNISYLLGREEVDPFIEEEGRTPRKIDLPFHAPDLKGLYMLVTGSGKYFKNVSDSPASSLGIVKVGDDGKSVDILWGLEDGSVPTSELPTHLMSHMMRLKLDPDHRVVMHTHATHLIAMTFIHELDEASFTKTLWQMCTECIVVFPDGVSLLPWMIPGTDAIGKETAEKMQETRLVVWPHHGVFGTGRTMDEAFGLIETAEKAAQVYSLVNGKIKQSITDSELTDLAAAFKVTPRDGILDL